MLTGSKKEVGMALNEMKSSDWFKALGEEDKSYVLQETKQLYAPPEKYENTLLNLFLQQGYEEEFLRYRREIYPYAVGDTGEVRMLKRLFVSAKLKSLLRIV